MKRIFAILTAMAMVFAVSVAAYADDAVLLTGSTELEGGSYWAMDTTFEGNDNAGGDPLPWVDDWTTISKVVLTSDSPFVIGYRMADGSWTQLDGQNEYTVDYTAGDIMVVNDGTTMQTGANEEGLAIPEFLIAISTGDAATFKIDYTIYGKEGAEATSETEAAAPESGSAEEPTEAEPEAALDSNSTPATKAPSTGLALAVVPAIVALAAITVSKKH